MAGTSGLKKRNFEGKKKAGAGSTWDINLGTSENGGVRSSLDGSDRQCQKSIQTRCSPTRFASLCTQLKNDTILNEQFQNEVSKMGFSSLLEMRSRTIFLPLVKWLINSFNIEDASLRVHGKRFILTPSSFEMVMGVEDGGEDFEQKGSLQDAKRLRDAVMAGNATLSIKQLEEDLKGAESVDDLFVTRFVLFAIGTLLMPSTSVCVGTSMVGLINCSESVRKKNWATKSFTYLVDAIRDFKGKKGAFVGGCVLFLQVFYLHHLEGHNQYIDKSILPIAAWTEEKSKVVVTWIKEGFGYGSKKIRMRGMDDGCSKCQSMHCDMINMVTWIKKLELEIQELRQLVIGLQQSNKSDREVVTGEGGSSRIVELVSSDREGVISESGGDRIVRNALDDDESNSDSHNQSTDPSDVSLDANSIDMYEKFVSSGGREIGRFKLTKPLSDGLDVKIAMYVFDESMDDSKVLAQFEDIILDREYLQNYCSSHLIFDWAVLGAYASMFSRISENRECRFLPSSFLRASFIVVEAWLNNMDRHTAEVAGWRKCLGNLAKCTKIVFPVEDYSSMAVVNLRDGNVVVWNYLPDSHQDPVSSREEAVIEALRILDHVFADDIKMVSPDGLPLQSFKIIHKTSEQQDHDERDSEVYMMKRMWAASKGLNCIPQPFNLDEFRLEVVIELVKSQFNEVHDSVLEKFSAHFDSLVKGATGRKKKVSSSNSKDDGSF